MANIFKKLFTKRKQPTKANTKAIDLDHARNSLNLTINRNTRLVNYCYDNVKNNANQLDSINQKVEDNYNEFVEESTKTNNKLNVVEANSNKNSEEILASQKEINNIDLKLIEITNDLKDLKPFRFVGIYDSTITYKINDLVEDNGALYLSIVDNNINNPTSDKAKWLLLDKPIPPIDLTPYLDKTTNMDQSIVGHVAVKDPIYAAHIANKAYVDSVVDGKTLIYQEDIRQSLPYPPNSSKTGRINLNRTIYQIDFTREWKLSFIFRYKNNEYCLNWANRLFSNSGSKFGLGIFIFPKDQLANNRDNFYIKASFFKPTNNETYFNYTIANTADDNIFVDKVILECRKN